MSAPRKRAAIRKAEYEIDRLQQKIMLLEHQYSVMKLIAEAATLVEREACANKIRDLRNQAVTPKFATMRECEAYSHALDAAESAIRARGGATTATGEQR